MLVHLIDGTYELFRCFYGVRRSTQQDDGYGAVRLVVHTLLTMLESGATHIGVATDRVIESFRNDLWPGYKTGAGIEPALWSQFRPLEDALQAFGIALWPMVELEADDALASAAHLAGLDDNAEKICIWTPDKDLAQCVRGDRIVQVDRRTGNVRDEKGVKEKFGVAPVSIPDYLALVGDSADGFPGIPGWGPKSAAALLSNYPHLEDVPLTGASVPGMRNAQLMATLRAHWSHALLFKQLATLRTDAALFQDVEEIRWRGPAAKDAEIVRRIRGEKLMERADRLAQNSPPR